MAKKRAKKQQKWPKDVDAVHDDPKINERAHELADEYASSLKAHRKASGKRNTARDNLIDFMDENGIEKIPVDTDQGPKTFNCEQELKIRVKKPEKEPEAAMA